MPISDGGAHVEAAVEAAANRPHGTTCPPPGSRLCARRSPRSLERTDGWAGFPRTRVVDPCANPIMSSRPQRWPTRWTQVSTGPRLPDVRASSRSPALAPVPVPLRDSNDLPIDVAELDRPVSPQRTMLLNHQLRRTPVRRQAPDPEDCARDRRARQRHVTLCVLSDDVYWRQYDPWVVGGRPPYGKHGNASVLDLTLADRTILLYAWSKSTRWTGLAARLSASSRPPREPITRCQSTRSSCTSGVHQYAAIAARDWPRRGGADVAEFRTRAT